MLQGKGGAGLTDVGGGTSVLQVAITLVGDVTGDTNRGTTVGNTRAESVDVTGLVATGETHVVVISVDGDVLVVLLGEFFNGGLDGLHTTRFTHGSGTVVGVAPGAIPVTNQRFRVVGNFDAPLFGKTDEKVAGHPEMVTHLDTLTRANLELPLGRHDLSVDAADLDTGIQADTVVRFDQITCKDLSGA
jgi:hypothetical protein